MSFFPIFKKSIGKKKNDPAASELFLKKLTRHDHCVIKEMMKSTSHKMPWQSERLCYYGLPKQVPRIENKLNRKGKNHQFETDFETVKLLY